MTPSSMHDAPLGRRRFARLLAAAGLGAPLGACAGGLVGAAPQLYTLTPKSTFDLADVGQAEWQLLIEAPVAAAGLDTNRIALLRDLTTLDYYANVAWTDRAPLMVQTLLVESFENSGKIVSVGRDSLGLRADFILKSELREMQVETGGGGPPAAHVALNAKLVMIPQREIVSNITFDERVPVNGTGFAPIIAALDEALGKVLRDLVSWTLREGASHWRRR
jgi:cholesterol transport system auxiliary component